jgi:hypothetical protein
MPRPMLNNRFKSKTPISACRANRIVFTFCHVVNARSWQLASSAMTFMHSSRSSWSDSMSFTSARISTCRPLFSPGVGITSTMRTPNSATLFFSPSVSCRPEVCNRCLGPLCCGALSRSTEMSGCVRPSISASSRGKVSCLSADADSIEALPDAVVAGSGTWPGSTSCTSAEGLGEVAFVWAGVSTACASVDGREESGSGVSCARASSCDRRCCCISASSAPGSTGGRVGSEPSATAGSWEAGVRGRGFGPAPAERAVEARGRGVEVDTPGAVS